MQTSLTDALRDVSDMAKAFPQDAAPGPLPTLATPEQIYAEILTLDLLRHPIVHAAQAEAFAKLRSHPNSQSVDGAATLERTVLLWTTTVLMQKIGEHIGPAFLVYADDTPHAWFGHEFPGVGVSGDNPDNIYRVAELDGSLTYEVHGQAPAMRPGQITVNLARALTGGGTTGSNTTDLGNQIKLFTGDDLNIGPDGKFTITVGPTDAPGNHMTSIPGRVALWFRESKNDWREPPIRLTIRCVDGPDRPAPTLDGLAAEVAGKIWEWCSRWAEFRMSYLGRPEVNTLSAALGRAGSWGYLSGGRWALGPDEAIIAVTDPQGARYTGMQMTDPWGLTLDARTTISARNMSQTKPNADGSATYVISPRDPGVENWIGAGGLAEGELRFRWQNVPDTFDPAKAVRSYRKVAFADLSRELPDLVGVVSTDARRAELERRALDYDTRWTA